MEVRQEYGRVLLEYGGSTGNKKQYQEYARTFEPHSRQIVMNTERRTKSSIKGTFSIFITS